MESDVYAMAIVAYEVHIHMIGLRDKFHIKFLDFDWDRATLEGSQSRIMAISRGRRSSRAALWHA